MEGLAPWFFVTDPWMLGLLFAAAVAAGLVDSIAGGGGLITVPALLAAGLPAPVALATNKLQACFGSGTALVRYARAGLVPRGEAGLAVGCTAVGAAAGTLTVGLLPPDWLAWLVPGALAAILVFVARTPSWGEDPHEGRWPRTLFYPVFGLALGFYDGFLGPGTGTFWTVALTTVLGYGLPQATAQTKVVNFTSNLVSLAVFVALGHLVWALGLVMGLGQALGARIGTSLALVRGARFIRGLFLTVAGATLAKLLWTALG